MNKITKFEKEVEKEYKGWKKSLTGGLDNTQVFLSLFILGCFYTIYSITNYTLRNTRDQYSVINACNCGDNARVPYRVSYYLLLGIWGLVHTCIFLQRNLKYIEFTSCCHDWNSGCKEKIGNCCDCLQKLVQNSAKFMQALRHYLWACITKQVWNCLRKRCYGTNDDSSSDSSNSPEPELDPQDKHYEKILWYRYYKLYVVGYSKDIKPPETETNSPMAQTKTSSVNNTNDYYCCSGCQSCIGTCRSLYRDIFQKWFVRTILVLLKYIAQGATVPILMIQVFDTYALLCFSPDGEYCETASEYKIHLAQAAITISFYFCIALAQLTSALLEWDKTSLAQENSDIPSSKI